MILHQIPLCCFVLWNPEIVEDNLACVVLLDQMWLWEENGQGRRWVLVTSKYEQLFMHREHEPRLSQGAMQGTHLESMPFLRTFSDPSGEKGHKTHPRALSFNPVRRSPSAWIIFPVAIDQKAGLPTHPPWIQAKSKQHCGIRAAGWKEHEGTAGQQLEEVWPCWQGDLRMANQRTQPATSGDSTAGLYLWIQPFFSPEVCYLAL